MAMIVFEHDCIESLRRELGRNGQLRALCEFDLFKFNPVPSSSAYTRFGANLMKHLDDVLQIFDALVELLRIELPDFGEVEGDDGTRKVKTLKNVSYDFKGTVYCYDQHGGSHRMAHGGFEKDRDCIKFRCPALHYGIACVSKKTCPVRTAVRIPLKEDRRIFVPLARQSYQWQTLYNKRAACERIYSRLDGNFRFEKHTIRGKRKMTLRVAMAYLVMLAMALGRIKANQLENIRSLVKVA